MGKSVGRRPKREEVDLVVVLSNGRWWRRRCVRGHAVRERLGRWWEGDSCPQRNDWDRGRWRRAGRTADGRTVNACRGDASAARDRGGRHGDDANTRRIDVCPRADDHVGEHHVTLR